MTIQDPCVSTGEPNCTYPPFDLGQEYDVWVKNADGSPLVGRVWPDDPVFFPDFTLARTHTWWTQMILNLHLELPFDGLWIDMNEPANFVDGSAKVQTSVSMCVLMIISRGVPTTASTIHRSSRTLLETALQKKQFAWTANRFVTRYVANLNCSNQSWSSHYDLHSMFGWSETEPTLRGVQATTGKRGLVLSR